MKKIIISLTLVTLLLLAMTAPAMAGEVSDSFDASVTVKEYVNVTFADTGDDGIVFGEVDAPSTNNPDTATSFDTAGSMLITTGSENNSTVTLSIMQSADWNASPAWPATDSKYCSTYDGTKRAFPAAGSYADMLDDSNDALTLDASNSQTIWHWLDVPDIDLDAGGYSATFNYKATTS